ncbi:PAS domain-containing protein [Rhizobium sp. TRM95111]|uniref:PAS domain-containing protein n=1 Tax=Rhizobium alarense TaxID=2846851 RepID=UPI001F23A062|nr:PAS domain-containing protein [Rhizobium alarense]MCF3639779.1 PAS domain-containing protein [Rhizobium alarense]
MQSRISGELYDYWRRVKGEGDAPYRHAVEPADIRALLPFLFILEQVPAAAPRFRLAGTRLCELFARELRGSDFGGVFAADIRNRVARIGGNTMAHGTPAVLEATAYGSHPRGTRVELVLLPMRSAGGETDRLIGALSPLEDLDLLAVPFRYMALDGVTAIDAAQGGETVASRPALPLAPPAATGNTMFGAAVRRVLHLKVFDGDKHR